MRSEEPSTAKLEESKDLDPENAEQESSEAEWVAPVDDESPTGLSPQQKAEELQRLQTHPYGQQSTMNLFMDRLLQYRA